ncbi:hypothetical protein L1049_025574 [Liquidambar formosana]|uniref:PUM-HD domain-containing protein n=1 Tax=Liquidambar formosana TaxID=63359 RepID=A0AAP0R8J0_LIQFO
MSGSPPGSRVPLQPDYSRSSSFSGGFCSSDENISPSPTPLEKSTYQTPSLHYFNRMWLDSKPPDSVIVKNANDYMLDEHGLSENLYRMSIRDEQKDCANIRQFQRDPDGYGFSGRSFKPLNVEKYDPCEGLKNGVSEYGGFQSSICGGHMSFGNGMKSALVGLPQGFKAGNSMGSYVTQNQSNALYSDPSCYKNQVNYLLEQRKEQGSSCYRRGIQSQNPSINRPHLNEDLFCSQRSGMVSNGEKGILNSLNSYQSMHPKLALGVENPPYNSSMLKERTRASKVPQSLLAMKSARDLEAFRCEDSLIIQGKSSNYVINKGCDLSRGHKKGSCDEAASWNLREKSLKLDMRSQSGGVHENDQSPISDCPLLLQPNYTSLAEVQGYIYFLAKDQQGCRFLQGMFDGGKCEDVRIIFNEIIDHVVELMMNPFGNYLMQKLLDVCNEEQRMQIVRMVTREPGQLVRISLNTHGTRVVQKLIETLKTRQQISSVILEIEMGFLDLSKDLNGNHVVQRCLQCLNNEDNKFIFDAATKFCVDIATHRHGCCVLQKCITHSTGERREKLVSEISANGLLLAQDAFGNYVVQYIIELEIPSATANLISQFKGNYVHLSMQKFSSHVVEKCLRYFDECRIIHELLSASNFEQLLQDPYANYVIQSALEVTKGPLHASLVEAVKPHTILRTSPYCKRIFSRNLLKK